MSSTLGKQVIGAGPAYEKSVHSYWAVNTQLEPTCIVQPRSAHEVSSAVKTLADGACMFAVRSGGHMTWAGANNIETGVTMDLSLMNSTVYHNHTGLASILPGSRWEGVYKELEKYNKVTTGGRTGPVGVGGFLLGGTSIIFYTIQMNTDGMQAATRSMLPGSASPATWSRTTRLSWPAATSSTPTRPATRTSSKH